MKAIRITQATASLAEYVRALEQGPLAITDKGKPIAALVPIEGVDMETLAAGTNPDFIDLLEHSRRRLEREGGFTSEQIREHFNLKPYNSQNSKPKKRKVKRAPKAK
jgi:prevent-host-death family protein